MFNGLIIVFVAWTSFIWNGIESQKTVEGDRCEDWRLKLRRVEEENELLNKSLENALISVERLKSQQKTCERDVTISLVKRLDQSSSSSFTAQTTGFGVTKYGGKIYVLSRNPNSIHVFENRNSFLLLNEFQLTQIDAPRDIVFNERSKCFYVTDYSDRCIWQVTVTDDNQTQVTNWLNGTTFPNTISLSSDGHLLVLRDGHSANSKNSQLGIYNGSDARLIRRLQLHSDVTNPRCAIQTKTGGEFLISHRMTANGRWVISRVTSNGQTVIARSNPRNNSEELNDPWYLSLDSDDDRLFVADFGNDRVVLFDSESLDFSQILLTRERNGIQQPNRLYYDKEKRHLIVGQYSNNGTGIADIYKIN